MMYMTLCVLLIISTLFLFDQLGVWLERKGWLYYRKRKPQYGMTGNTLQELNAILAPSNRHVIEVKKTEVVKKKHEADDRNLSYSGERDFDTN